MSSKQCPVLVPQTVACSGHGQCDTTLGECVCESGWTGLGDYAIQSGADCDIYVVAIQALWIIAVVLEFVTLLLTVRYFRLKFLYHKSAFERKSLLELMRDPMIMFPLWAFFGSVMVIVLGLLRICFTEERVIGIDFGVTFVGFLFVVSILCSAAGLVKAFSGFLMSSVRMMPEVARERIRMEAKIIEKILPFFNVAVVLVSALVLPVVWYPGLLPVFAGIHFVGYSLLNLMMDYLFLLKSISPVITELKKHINRASIPGSMNSKEGLVSINTFLRKLEIAYTVLGSSELVIPIIYALFGVWPYLLRKASYFLPVCACFASICSSIVVLSVTNFKTSPTTSLRQDSKSGKGDTVQEHVVASTNKQTPGNAFVVPAEEPF